MDNGKKAFLCLWKLNQIFWDWIFNDCSRFGKDESENFTILEGKIHWNLQLIRDNYPFPFFVYNFWSLTSKRKMEMWASSALAISYAMNNSLLSDDQTFRSFFISHCASLQIFLINSFCLIMIAVCSWVLDQFSTFVHDEEEK